MNVSDFNLGYQPKCSVYARKLKKGKTYYLKYYLPNGVRVRRPCHEQANMAQRLCALKERQLLLGEFDELDREHLGAAKAATPNRPTLEEALTLYLEATKSRKGPQSHAHDKSALRQYVAFFQGQGKIYADEVKAVDVQLLIGHLDQRGLAVATLHGAVRMVRKFYNFLIEDAELWEGKNPVPKKPLLPNRGSKVRNRLANNSEIERILAIDPEQLPNLAGQPVGAMIRFLVFTGARLGEVLHAEWSDFNLEQGTWTIQHKPHCPTRNGLGWSPKWNKSRKIELFPEALQLLKSLPRLPTVGLVPIRNAQGKITGHQAHQAEFVFPKQVARRDGKGNRQVTWARQDSLKHSWASIKKAAGVANLQIKDLRTYFNSVLRSRYGLSAKEAGAYLGNSAEINELHYTPLSTGEMSKKLQRLSLTEAMNLQMNLHQSGK
ncbi:MAG: hypothetical protein A2527_14745 [Candidatus Lambdaproteobacteria bacterium RIFOXYD2_FULL_50_16]|uniref:Core-binding (CB) domain-containing protein n=1 Tax=Candidatus Lambdaproteobacteria bacterium RIFOXYD2_FULL_50_16 TaxID=1817772 RepID=A0A1F6G5T6_9PROT|nr:MAG: hypothetical protein A2527_14745 [Candidatus Lambdaproteobacteria bacterium RIFOXYD2_FULL_50_16]